MLIVVANYLTNPRCDQYRSDYWSLYFNQWNPSFHCDQ